MKINRFFISVVVVFATIFFMNWFWHGIVMKGMYLDTAALWRTEEGMRDFLHWMVLGQFIIAFMFCVIFAKGYEGRGLLEGLRYGLYITILFSGVKLIHYAVIPYNLQLVGMWVSGDLLIYTLSGLLQSFIYQRFSSR